MAFRTNKTPVLQTKSASGSVATFNTALAMPLSSCNIAVNAWQEGSGDPSPDNVRPIHGFSEVNATRVGKNLLNPSDVPPFAEQQEIALWGTSYSSFTNFFNSLPQGQRYYISLDYEIKSLSSGTTTEYGFIFFRNGATSIPKRQSFSNRSVGQIIHFETFYDKDNYGLNSVNFYSAGDTVILKNFQIEAGLTATAYEPYVAPTIYTIQLGQEVYGAEVDVVNGVAHVTHKIIQIKNLDLRWTSGNSGYFYSLTLDKADGVMNMLSDVLQNTDLGLANMPNYSVKGADNANTLYIKATDYTDVASLKEAIGDNYLVYELATPTETQLTPQQIETLIGNNTIFADTGDVDLTYKDLDIAKRGNFREVFRLPS